MTLTPEQFNKLVTKDEFNELKGDFKKIDKKVDQILDVVENIATDQKTTKQELLMNQAAHDRFDKRINKLERLQFNL